MPGIHTEQTFEDAIEQELLANGGYVKGYPEDFDRELAIDKKTLISFLKTSQPKEWEKLDWQLRIASLPFWKRGT